MAHTIKKYLLGGAIFLFPTCLSRILVNIFKNYHISKDVKIGFSLLLSDDINIGPGVRIGHLNFISNRRFILMGNDTIRHLNIIWGHFDLSMGKDSRINSMNKISGPHRTVSAISLFEIGERTSIVLRHNFDLTDSIIIKDRVSVAGSGSQFWTHAFYKGTEKDLLVHKPIVVGDRCYFGSRAMICMGVNITHDVAVGANTVVTKSLDKPGLYVSQGLRYIEYDADKTIEKLEKELNNPS